MLESEPIRGNANFTRFLMGETESISMQDSNLSTSLDGQSREIRGLNGWREVVT